MRSACNHRNRLSAIGGAAMILGWAAIAPGQYAVEWATVDGGGGQSSAGGAFALSGTIGQPDARNQTMAGGSFALTGGFWVLPSCLACPADFDMDCDVDGGDLTLFVSCAVGSAVPHDVSPLCQTVDLDGDGDVDADDFGIFQRCWSGSLPTDPNCAD